MSSFLARPTVWRPSTFGQRLEQAMRTVLRIFLTSMGFLALFLPLLGGVAFAQSRMQAQAPAKRGIWKSVGNMSTPREGHIETTLKNGMVLVAGGIAASNQVLASAELYDPATGKWSLTGSMNYPRTAATATL